MVWVTAPGSRTTGTIAVWSTCSVSPLKTLVWKPVSPTAILYSPTGRDGALKSPCSLVATLRTRPVLMCVMVTEQFGRTPPVESETVPRRFPVATWAQQIAAVRAAMMTIVNRRGFIYLLKTGPAFHHQRIESIVLRLYINEWVTSEMISWPTVAFEPGS